MRLYLRWYVNDILNNASPKPGAHRRGLAISSRRPTANGRKEVEEFFTNVPFTLLSFSQHLVHSPLIELDGADKATGKWHFFVPCTFAEGNVATWISRAYDEIYVKRDRAWFILDIKVKFFFITPFDQGWAKVPNMLAG